MKILLPDQTEIEDRRTSVNQQMHRYEIQRIDGPPIIPCDTCLGGSNAPWHIQFLIQTTRAYLLCAQCVLDIMQFGDLCADCLRDPTAERECDNCGKVFTRKKAPVVVVEETPAEEPQEVASGS